MFKNSPKKDKRTLLEKEIDSVLRTMEHLSPGSEVYAKMADNLVKLYEAKATEKSRRVSPDTVLTVLGSAFGIVWITHHEKLNVISSKAMQFVLRGRV